MATAPDSETYFSAPPIYDDQDDSLPPVYSAFTEEPPVSSKERNDSPADQRENNFTIDQSVANDSQSEDDDLYLSECRIMLVGFDVSRMRTLVDMVRRGGASRYMSFGEKLTHVVVGNPSEM